MTNSAYLGASGNIDNRWKQIGNVMNGPQGHGYAAELYNDTIDRFKLFNRVEYLGQEKGESGRIIKNGADRRVNGVNIQTKYYKSAEKTINAAFEKGQAQYLNPDGTMMQIEVPSDQYKRCCELMEKRIKKGEVPGANPNDAKREAKRYVKQGALTYKQSHNITKSGCVASLTFDALQGVICSAEGATLMAMITFANAIWNGLDSKEAIRASFSTFVNIVGRASLNSIIIGQLSRNKIANVFAEKIENEGFQTVANPLYKVSDKIATKISTSAVAESTIGKTLKLNAVDGAKLLSGTIMFTITFGPDICRALVGRISPQQLFKNSCVGAAGLVGGAIGQAIIPIPVLGAFVGGAVAGFVAKKTLDNFIEDDAKEMYQILKEEFLDVVMIAGLNQTEFQEVIGLTFGHKKLPHMLRDMYQYGDSRTYARDNIVSEAVISVYSKRTKITEEMFNKAIIDLAEDEYEDIVNETDESEPVQTVASIVDTEYIKTQMPDQEKYEETIKNAVDMRNCVFCGAELSKTDKFCCSCGNKVANT